MVASGHVTADHVGHLLPGHIERGDAVLRLTDLGCQRQHHARQPLLDPLQSHRAVRKPLMVLIEYDRDHTASTRKTLPCTACWELRSQTGGGSQMTTTIDLLGRQHQGVDARAATLGQRESVELA